MKKYSYIILSISLFFMLFNPLKAEEVTNSTDTKEVSESEKEKFFAYPNITKYVVVSNHDINRIHCTTGFISNIWYAKNKGISVDISGADAVLTYDIRFDTVTNRSQYIKNEHALHFKCGESYYQLRAKPSDTKTKIIYARADVKKKVKRNKKTRELSDKEMMTLMFKKAEDGAYQKLDKIYVSEIQVKGAKLTLRQFVSSIEGNFTIDMYRMSTNKPIEFKRRDFNLAVFRKDIVAINLSSNVLKKGGEEVILTLISRRNDN